MGVSCAFAEEADDDDDAEEATERVCVNKRNINSFDAIDDEHVYIKATGNKHFLFTMRHHCFGLRNAQGIGIKDTMSSVCSGSFGEIVYRDMGRRLESCGIDTIERVASRDDAKGLVEDRKQLKREEKDAKQ
jgi:hypothetical protein